MTDESTASAEAFPEARGPHLPDAVTRLGALIWVFVLLALARLIWFIRETPLVAPFEVSDIVAYGAAIVPSVVVVLMPAALLWRHRDAPDSARTLLLGMVLFVVVEGLRVLNPPLQPIFEQLTPGSEETPFLVPLALVYNAAILLLGSYSIANIGVGLARARRYQEPSGGGMVGTLMVVAVSLVAVGGVVSVGQLPFDRIPITPTVVLYLASTVVLSVVFAAAWAYLASVTIRGARAGEVPESGWASAAIGSGLIVAAYTARAVLITFTPTPDSQPLFTSIGYALSVTIGLGYLGLLAGLLLGLPSLAAGDDADEGEDDDDADHDDEDDLDTEDALEPEVEERSA